MESILRTTVVIGHRHIKSLVVAARWWFIYTVGRNRSSWQDGSFRLSPTARLKFGDLFVVCVSIKEIGHVPKRELLQQRAQKESPTHGLFVSRAGDEIFAGDEGAGFVHIAGLAKWRDYILAPGCVKPFDQIRKCTCKLKCHGL